MRATTASSSGDTFGRRARNDGGVLTADWRLGDGSDLVSEDDELRPWTQVFNQWPERAIFTPKSVTEWSVREAALAAFRESVVNAVDMHAASLFKGHHGVLLFHNRAARG